AAASGLFRAGPEALDEAQSAVLAALVRSPAAAPLRVGRRACVLLDTLADRNAARVDCARVEMLARSLASRSAALASESDAPHLARRLLRVPGTQVRATLDAGLQRFATETLRNHLAELADRNVEDGAVVVLDNATGDVLAYVGSSGDLSAAADVD